jgi:hypothetical protein
LKFQFTIRSIDAYCRVSKSCCVELAMKRSVQIEAMTLAGKLGAAQLEVH